MRNLIALISEILGGHTRDPDFLPVGDEDDVSSESDPSSASPITSSSDFKAVSGATVAASPSKYGIDLGGPLSRFSIEPYERYCPPGTTAAETDKPTCKTLRPHFGRDFTRPGDGTRGAPAIASLGGTVTTGTGGASGNYITIDHDDGSRTVYMHLESFSKASGERAEAGEMIGTVGSTGRASGPHLHFEIYPSGVQFKNGNQINPTEWFDSNPNAFFPIGIKPSRVTK